LTGNGLTGSDANGNAFGVFVLARVGFAGIGVEEESSAPHTRLGYVHLRISFIDTVSATVDSVTVSARAVNRKSAPRRKKRS
jgi:hypothetical protein